MGSLPVTGFRIAATPWSRKPRTVNGQTVKLIAVQTPLRKRRGKRTYYFYQIGTGREVWRNHNPAVPVYKPVGYPASMARLYSDILIPSDGHRTEKQLAWLARNGFELAAGA